MSHYMGITLIIQMITSLGTFVAFFVFLHEIKQEKENDKQEQKKAVVEAILNIVRIINNQEEYAKNQFLSDCIRKYINFCAYSKIETFKSSCRDTTKADEITSCLLNCSIRYVTPLNYNKFGKDCLQVKLYSLTVLKSYVQLSGTIKDFLKCIEDYRAKITEKISDIDKEVFYNIFAENTHDKIINMQDVICCFEKKICGNSEIQRYHEDLKRNLANINDQLQNYLKDIC